MLHRLFVDCTDLLSVDSYEADEIPKEQADEHPLQIPMT